MQSNEKKNNRNNNNNAQIRAATIPSYLLVHKIRRLVALTILQILKSVFILLINVIMCILIRFVKLHAYSRFCQIDARVEFSIVLIASFERERMIDKQLFNLLIKAKKNSFILFYLCKQFQQLSLYYQCRMIDVDIYKHFQLIMDNE